MKKNQLFAFVSVFSTLSLTSCLLFNPQDIIDFFKKSSNQPNGDLTFVEKTEYTDRSIGSASNLNVKTLGLGFDYHYLSSIGSPKILVIPIEVKDAPFKSGDLDRIQKGFFGDSSETGWESVSSFYEKSSYGALKIRGEVSDVVTLDKTKKELIQLNETYAKKGDQYTDAILNTALTQLDKKGFDFSSFDTDNDHYLDGVWMVYSAPYIKNESAGGDLFWAFTTWISDYKRYDNLYASTYAWASVDFFTEKEYGYPLKADAHTFIHETGHMMGLEDYYSYDADQTTNFDAPMAGGDMMDFNIGDHNAFSKYLMNWGDKPTVITEEYLDQNNGEVVLPSFESKGKSFILPVYRDGQIHHNNTPFDEYLMLFYYTPTGLNKEDSQNTYANGLRHYSTPGVAVLHVNSIVGKLLQKNGSIYSDGYQYNSLPDFDPNTWGFNFLYTPLYSNTQTMSYGDLIDDSKSNCYKTRLCSLITKNGVKPEVDVRKLAKNAFLYGKGDSFSTNHPNFTFDDGSKLNFDFTVTNVASTSATLSISYQG